MTDAPRVTLRAVRAIGYPGGWRVDAFSPLWLGAKNASAIMLSFRYGESIFDIARECGLSWGGVESILRAMMLRDKKS